MAIDDGGPAFPGGNLEYSNEEHPPYNMGMTLRDWFAGQALAGITSINTNFKASIAAAALAYEIADAMIEQRKAKR